MCNIIICNSIQAECSLIKDYLLKYSQKHQKEFSIKLSYDRAELINHIKSEEPDFIIMAENGVDGLDIITSINYLSNKIIWISDLNFSIQAYYHCIAYFCMKPISYEKIEDALNLSLPYQ